VFAGSYFWEAQTAGAPRWPPPTATTTRYAAAALLALSLAALIEVAFSFGRFPFTYGQRCREVHPLADDGWTNGALRVPVPAAAASVKLAVLPDRPDLDRRPLDLDLSILSGSGSILETRRYSFTERVSDSQSFQLLMPIRSMAHARN
jgi:hypothetical protein